MSKLVLKEVTKRLQRKARTYGPAPTWYFKSNIPHLANIPVPVQRNLHAKELAFLKTSDQKQREVWNYIWKNGEYFEVLNQALFFFDKRRAFLDERDWKILKTWVNRIDNWAHSDTLCGIFAALNENYPVLVFPQLEKWNLSKNPWHRRISIVSLFYYSALRKKHPKFSDVTRFIENLLLDKHLYVQKGIGWTLRESFNVYPERTLLFIEKHVRILHPAAWQAATEKLSVKTKNKLKRIRNAGK